MYKLNLPQFDYKLKKAEDKVLIFDVIRKKYLVLTPEEWVRQHFINYLLSEKKIPKSLIRIEGGLVYNALQKRSDIVVYDRNGAPWLIVECKSPTVPVSPAALAQAALYNATLRAPYVSVTNGLVHIYAHVEWEKRMTMQLEDIPLYPE